MCAAPSSVFPARSLLSQVRKGMVLVDERLKPVASWEFDADIAILTHSTTIQPRYQAVIHCEIIRQAARVVAMDRERECLRTDECSIGLPSCFSAFHSLALLRKYLAILI